MDIFGQATSQQFGRISHKSNIWRVYLVGSTSEAFGAYLINAGYQLILLYLRFYLIVLGLKQQVHVVELVEQLRHEQVGLAATHHLTRNQQQQQRKVIPPVSPGRLFFEATFFDELTVGQGLCLIHLVALVQLQVVLFVCDNLPWLDTCEELQKLFRVHHSFVLVPS